MSPTPADASAQQPAPTIPKDYFKVFPSAEGYYKQYGGAFLPPAFEAEMLKVNDAYFAISKSHKFVSELRSIRKHYQGCPTPVYFCNRLSEKYGGRIYLKREDLNHTGAHKLNHCMGEALLAKYMGKKKVIAETGAGQHGVAIATAATYFGLECEIHMGEVDMAKEHPNVVRMKILGATVVPVTHDLKTLKEAVDSAFEAYVKDPITSIYCIGSVVGPHPFPMMVRDFQKVIDEEACEQFLDMTGELPDSVVACVDGGSNAMDISLHARRGGQALRRGARRPLRADWRPRRDNDARLPGPHPRLQVLPSPGREGRAAARVLGRQRPRLPRCRPRAQHAARHQPRHVPLRL